ncbi:uncharacterized protein TRUGW13939_10716 [Talaromyces rugulosus]|uniref:Uncharacterized protein n=1 Tax=Talaromyces rugulosus TaxID=121627 RepID=A0A7H8RDE0_TALRU|nr:uncharacterized protein TRUGW13939_10716 [Talaromyces rugulosus]QKX63545.1 hypothetical protein TRUGW13939_10716 [Talaromyces rugulosus]
MPVSKKDKGAKGIPRDTNRSSDSCLLPLSERDTKKGVCYAARTKEKNGANFGEYSLSAMIATVFLHVTEEAEQKTLAAARLRPCANETAVGIGRVSTDGRETGSRMRKDASFSEIDTRAKPSNRQNARGGRRANSIGDRQAVRKVGKLVREQHRTRRTCSCSSPDCASGPRRPAVAGVLLCGGPSCKFLRARLTQRDPTQPGCTTPCLLHHERCPPPPPPPRPHIPLRPPPRNYGLSHSQHCETHRGFSIEPLFSPLEKDAEGMTAGPCSELRPRLVTSILDFGDHRDCSPALLRTVHGIQ